jgi:hypothetical protein
MAPAAKSSSFPKDIWSKLPNFATDPALSGPSGDRRGGGLSRALRFFIGSVRFGGINTRVLALLVAEADAVCEAAGALAHYAAGAEARDTGKRLRQLKIRIKESESTLVVSLRASAISPMAHEDIHSMSVNLGKVLEGIENVASLPQEIVRGEAQLVELSASCAQSIRSAVAALPGGHELARRTFQLAAVARQVDFDLRDAMLTGLAEERDLVQHLQQAQAIRTLRVLFQRYRNMARTLEYAAIKNG